MTRKKIDYSMTIIYKIICHDLKIKDSYIGSTTCFKGRKSNHKLTCNNSTYKNHNMKLYVFIRENGGWNNWSMLEIEKYPCNDKRESEARERYWYEELKGTLNSQFPQRSSKEWRQDNKVHVSEYNKTYADDNKEKIQKYRLANRERDRNKLIKWREKNNYVVVCECGSSVKNHLLSKHKKSKKHINFIQDDF
mmetsp:Transcript_43994/g.56389  ORF Transcript_43994/g.56389 Transcript_43994/m.56389 type:complete len:193 (-) Transcript_43994:9-587(-)